MDYQNQQAPQQPPVQQQPVQQPPYQQPPYQQQPVMQAPATTKPRSAYIAALLHLFFGALGLGYYYRGIEDKAKNCWIMLIVGACTSVLFGIGAILITIVTIINMVEAVKLFAGKYPVDAYGRPLALEF